MIKQKSQGFSLVELMVVIAIIATLSIMAIPTFANYINKGHLSEVFNALKADEANIVTYISTNSMPTNAATAAAMLTSIGGLGVCNSIYVSTAPGACTFGQYGIQVTTSTTSTTFSPLPLATIYMTPIQNGSLIQWYCSYNATTTDTTNGTIMLPLACQQANPLTSSPNVTSVW